MKKQKAAKLPSGLASFLENPPRGTTESFFCAAMKEFVRDEHYGYTQEYDRHVYAALCGTCQYRTVPVVSSPFVLNIQDNKWWLEYNGCVGVGYTPIKER